MATEALVTHLNEQRRRVNVDFYDFSIRELLAMLETGELNISPSYQRVFRWDEEAESRLIESMFLELPIPSVFAAINADFTWELVDGIQRVKTLAHFVGSSDELLARVKRATPLVLEGLTQLPDLNGRTFESLPPELRTYFVRRTLRITALNDQSDTEARFDLFERLNKGAVSLTEQEVRACVYQGPFLQTIEKLAKTDKFVTLTKLQAGNEKNGTREELVLKFFAYLYGRDSFKGNVAKFLSLFMRDAESNLDLTASVETFEAAVDFLYDVTGGEPFLRTGVTITPQNQFEAVLVGSGEIIDAGGTPVTPPAGWTTDQELVDASTGGTNTKAMLARRIDRAVELFSQP